MTEVFQKDELKKVSAKRTRMIAWYTAAAAVVVAADVLLMVFLKPISYAGGLAANIVLTAVFGCATLFFFDLPFRMVEKYRKLLLGLNDGLRATGSGVFLFFGEESVEENGVGFVEVVLEETLYGKTNEHRLLLEKSHALPDFHTGDTVAYESRANLLTAYEVTERIPDDLLSEEERSGKDLSERES